MNVNEEIKIPRKLFVDLINYFYPDDESVPQGVLADEIRHQIEDKIQKITNRVLFTKYKTATSSTERERFRREYLVERGISNSFISDTEKHYEND